MIQKLVKHGKDYALVIDATIAERLKFDEHTPLELTADGDRLVVAAFATDEISDEEFRRVAESINERYSKTFKRLAEES